jgi:hypothetical protein
MKKPKFFQFSILELEAPLIRHPVMDKIGNVPRDWFMSRGFKAFYLNIGNFGFTIGFHDNGGAKLQNALEDARDYSVQKTKETQNAARLRDILVRNLYSDQHWESLVSLCSMREKGKDRALSLKVEKTLQHIEDNPIP